MRILDATAGARSIWYQKKHPFVLFIDKRKEKLQTQKPGYSSICKKTWNVNPDMVVDWTEKLPFDKESFDMIVFDPPHRIKKDNQKSCIITEKYGYLKPDSYKLDLKNGIRNLFDVLKQEGIFILKWNEEQIPLQTILKLFPYSPMFGTRTGQKNKTHWILFLKYRLDKTLTEGT